MRKEFVPAVLLLVAAALLVSASGVHAQSLISYTPLSSGHAFGNLNNATNNSTNNSINGTTNGIKDIQNYLKSVLRAVFDLIIAIGSIIIVIIGVIFAIRYMSAAGEEQEKIFSSIKHYIIGIVIFYLIVGLAYAFVL